MTVRFNDQLLLWAISVLQPASAGDALRFLNLVFPSLVGLPQVKDVRSTVDRWVEGEQVVRVHARSRLYSLTAKGNHLMPVPLRRARDKARLFLLKDARLDKVWLSGDAPERLAGDSPAESGSSGIQEARPISAAAASRSARSTGRAYWPRVAKQLQVGSDWRSPDTFFDLFSFPDSRLVHRASDRPAEGGDLSVTDLALAIGISPRLVTSFIHKPENHYRVFSIGKRGGGERTISSPRLFLKVVQYWLVDYVLYRLPQHPSTHAYQTGRSIITNASQHVNQAYVGNVDIKDFFPSIRSAVIAQLLTEHGIGSRLSDVVSRLTSLHGGLPQGAPTSPLLSNAVLFHVDELMAAYCAKRDATYTRYADDITISASSRAMVSDAFAVLRLHLGKTGLQLNEAKTRIASRSGQQKVTGVVVNDKVQPPREFRRRVRAIFHRSLIDPTAARERLSELRGYVGYLKSFPSLRDSKRLRAYADAIARLEQ